VVVAVHHCLGPGVGEVLAEPLHADDGHAVLAARCGLGQGLVPGEGRSEGAGEDGQDAGFDVAPDGADGAVVVGDPELAMPATSMMREP
jgi:hypothetical protein